jgi:hypothetical protein
MGMIDQNELLSIEQEVAETMAAFNGLSTSHQIKQRLTILFGWFQLLERRPESSDYYRNVRDNLLHLRALRTS